MPKNPNLETRVSTLEREVEALKRQGARSKPAANWIDQIVGSMEDFPEFEEVLRLGQEIRRQDRPRDAQSGDEATDG